MKKLAALVLVITLSTSMVAAHYIRSFDPHVVVSAWPHGKKMAFAITCDDISAGYPLEYFDEIESTLETYGFRATFFVIPYHGEWDLLTESPALVRALHAAQDRGHEIALHGYAHYENEFTCSPEKQEKLLEKALSVMGEAGFNVKGFRAPCLKETAQTQNLLKKYGFVYDASVFRESGEPSLEGELPEVPSGHEYTWYLDEKELVGNLALATLESEIQYRKGSVFSLVIHMKAVNEGEGITFLEQFLPSMAEKKVWNCTLLELVEWEMRVQKVKWEKRKTITGGEITFENVPRGLTVEIGLPHNYQLKDLPEGIDVTDTGQSLFTLTFDQDFEKVTLSFGLTYKSLPETDNELAVLCTPDSGTDSPSRESGHSLQYSNEHDSNLGPLKTLLNAWEIPLRTVAVGPEITTDLLGSSSFILVDKSFLKRPLTLRETILLYSLENRVIIFSKTDKIPLFFLPKMSQHDLNYIASPLEIRIVNCYGGFNLGYYRIRGFKGRSTYLYIEKLRDDSPPELYYNLLVRSLFVSSPLPVRKPFFSLEIDDCAMYRTYNQGHAVTAGINAYRNSLDLAESYKVKPLYGFTTSYFMSNPEIEEIFSLLKTKSVLVANHGYEHSLNFANPQKLEKEISQATADLEKVWGEPPRIILIPAHEMNQESMVQALTGSPITVVGARGRQYLYGVFKDVFFYERTGLQIPSNSVNDAPPFLSLFLYSQIFPPSFYAVTHIFNYAEKGAAYQHIADCLSYLVNTGYEPSDTQTMVEEDFFWSCVKVTSLKRGNLLIIHLSGTENLPQKEYTIHFMVYGNPTLQIDAGSSILTPYVSSRDRITYVTLLLRPEKHPRK